MDWLYMGPGSCKDCDWDITNYIFLFLSLWPPSPFLYCSDYDWKLKCRCNPYEVPVHYCLRYFSNFYIGLLFVRWNSIQAVYLLYIFIMRNLQASFLHHILWYAREVSGLWAGATCCCDHRRALALDLLHTSAWLGFVKYL